MVEDRRDARLAPVGDRLDIGDVDAEHATLARRPQAVLRVGQHRDDDVFGQALGWSQAADAVAAHPRQTGARADPDRAVSILVE